MWFCFYKPQAEDKQCLTPLRKRPSLAHWRLWIRSGQIYWQTWGDFPGHTSCLPPLPPGNLKLHTSPAALMCHGARDKSSLWKQTKKLLWKLLTSIVSLTSCYHCTWSCSGLTKDTSKDIRPLSKSILSSKKEFLVSWIKDHTHHPPYILPFLCFCSPFPTVESSQWSSAGVWQSAPI